MSGRECQCCFQEKPHLIICEKQHVVCSDCRKRLGRTDCLFCQPHRRSVRIHISEEEPPTTDTSRNTASRPLHDICLITYYLAKAVAIFMGFVYLGKVLICLYFATNPHRDRSWFGWDNFRYVIAEAILGIVALGILAGCCLGSRS